MKTVKLAILHFLIALSNIKLKSKGLNWQLEERGLIVGFLFVHSSHYSIFVHAFYAVIPAIFLLISSRYVCCLLIVSIKNKTYTNIFSANSLGFVTNLFCFLIDLLSYWLIFPISFVQ